MNKNSPSPTGRLNRAARQPSGSDNAAGLKRGGGQTLISLDLQGAEDRYRLEPADEETPDRAYEKRWRATLPGDRRGARDDRGGVEDERFEVTGRFGKLLRDEIADTVDDPEDVDAEVKYLLTIV